MTTDMPAWIYSRAWRGHLWHRRLKMPGMGPEPEALCGFAPNESGRWIANTAPGADKPKGELACAGCDAEANRIQAGINP